MEPEGSRAARAAVNLSAPWFLVTDLADIRWLTGFSGSAGTALLGSDGTVRLFVDGRYDERARDEARATDGHVEVVRSSGRPELLDLVTATVGGAELGVDPAALTLAQFDALSSRMSVSRTDSPVRPLRRVKDAAELALIERCATTADASLQAVVADGLSGRSEREIRRRLDESMTDRGADGVSFPTIVASGPNAARPHHEPSDRTVRDGDVVIIDMGAEIDGYRSDMTRTVRVGRVPEAVDDMWEVVREAQQAGLDAVRPGVTGRGIDEAVREVFRRHGREHEYLHGTGHGVGLVIHEQPILGPGCSEQLLLGEVVTVEPGLYRVGTGGVRIEDLVVVTEHGCRILTQTPKELPCPPSARTT